MKWIAHAMLSVFLTGFLSAQVAASEKQTAQDLLKKATIFGFGVKEGQAVDARVTDAAYRTLMSCKDAKQQFLEVFENGKVHGKCYALCALHRLDPTLFAKLSAGMNGKQKVRVRDGCCYSDSTVREIIESIEKGRYGHWAPMPEIHQKQ